MWTSGGMSKGVRWTHVLCCLGVVASLLNLALVALVNSAGQTDTGYLTVRYSSGCVPYFTTRCRSSSRSRCHFPLRFLEEKRKYIERRRSLERGDCCLSVIPGATPYCIPLFFAAAMDCCWLPTKDRLNSALYGGALRWLAQRRAPTLNRRSGSTSKWANINFQPRRFVRQ